MALHLRAVPDIATQMQAIFHAFADLLFVMDGEGRIIDYKVRDASNLYGPPGSILNRYMQDILPAAVGRLFNQSLKRSKNSGEVSIFEYALPLQKGERYFEARLVPVQNDQVIAVVTDITAQKQAQLDLQRHIRRLAALRAIDLAITSSLDLNLTLSMLLSQVTSQLEVDAACILLLNPGSQVLEYTAGHGFRTSALQFTRLRLGEGYAGRAALSRKTVSISNLKARRTDFLRSPAFVEESFIGYFAVPLISKGQVRGVLEIFHRAELNPSADWLGFLDTLAGQAAIATDSAMLFDDLQRSNVELVMAYDATIEGWSRALDLRDKETEGHTQRVSQLTLRLARDLGAAERELIHLRRGALLHDIGKMGIPDEILLKPGPLDAEEWRIMKLHPVYAYELLSPIAFLKPALDIPYCHHEKYDGSGYPRGLRGSQIPLAARIFAVADVYDALTSDRPYRKAWLAEKAREFILGEAGKHFDPEVVEVFARWSE
jgi:putative nucleotidyltransferase with HDIG domain